MNWRDWLASSTVIYPDCAFLWCLSLIMVDSESLQSGTGTWISVLIMISKLPIGHDTIVYGSDDAGRSIYAKDKKFLEKIKKAAQLLNLKPHTYRHGTETLFTATDVEGHIGKDKRFVFDFWCNTEKDVECMLWTLVGCVLLNFLTSLLACHTCLDIWGEKIYSLMHVFMIVQNWTRENESSAFESGWMQSIYPPWWKGSKSIWLHWNSHHQTDWQSWNWNSYSEIVPWDHSFLCYR